MVKIPANLTAKHKIELSQLDPRAIQREAMGTDLDVEKFTAYLSSLVRVDLTSRITDANVERTIEGASTLAVTIEDFARTVLRSGLLSSKLDVQLDGLWFRLAAVDKNSDDLTLTFEDREVAILREYAKWKVARRSKTTRAEFVLNLIREATPSFGQRIPVVIPELSKIQPIERWNNDITGADVVMQKGRGIDPNYNTKASQAYSEHTNPQRIPPNVLTVKNVAATPTQIKNANIILQVGDSLGARRKLLVCAIMTAIQESSITAIPDKAHGGNSDADSAGIFQQRPGWGSYEERMDPETTARLFFQAAIKEDKIEPDVPYWTLCADVQNPKAEYRTLYAKWRQEAEYFVRAYGSVGGANEGSAADSNGMASNTGSGGEFLFWRGKVEDHHGQKVRKPENTWSCIQRLADEVDWRAFFVSGTFYFISEDDLFKQKPILTLREFTPGLLGVDGNYDRNKKSGTLTITADVGRWMAPPGSVVVVEDMGPWNGRWIVNDFSRSLFDLQATITLKKPRPQLPEPAGGNSNQINQTWFDQPSTAKDLPSKDLRIAVLNSQRIRFEHSSQRQDILTGQIDDRVLKFLLWLTNDQGYSISISALKSDHNKLTSEGRVSAHGAGRAVDVDTFNYKNPATDTVMRDIANNQVMLGFDQLIGPNPLLVIPLGIYDAQTLNEHKSHIHVGWALS